ncbi:MAG: 3-oxoacyl-[acyl-carrier-protein] reductase [Anaeromyxobacter sp. RBG_16_69_14]|nr:MAG: 3-oxoacyl-[acyl-carrier-protein] reductase [Anaeromyxobacter sp. RBG_16_69_14]
MYDFKGKTALVTGAARGIGRAIALELARGGASLALNDVNEAAAKEAVELAEKEGAPKAKFYKFDVADSAACNAAIDSVLTDFGGLHILVNNAGISIDALVMRFKDEDWKKTLDINLTGAFNLMRAATRPMMKQRSGAIVNIASVVGETGNAGQAAYSASKGALIALTKTVARELASRSIRVNAVAPGFIDTPMTQALPEAAKAKLAEAIPLARLGTAQDIADCVAWLASDKASYVTGGVIRVNGGMYM